jgi:hypothetical protein
VNTAKRFALLGVLAIAGSTGACNSFLEGGDLSKNPNTPTTAAPQSIFAGVQGSVWALLSSDPARLTSVWTQQFEGAGIQYGPVNDYVNDETTTGGFEAGLYTGGGLIDIRAVEAAADASGDSLLKGQTEVLEGLMFGTGADLFGDLVYSQALTNTPNPTLDPQMTVYADMQTLLSKAIVDLDASGPSNLGAGGSDLSFNGDKDAWIALAHTIKARLYLHTAEVVPGAYADAKTEAALGIQDNTGDYKAIWSGSIFEQNYWYQFNVVQRAGYIAPAPFLVGLLTSMSDPRIDQYFKPDTSINPVTHVTTVSYNDLSDERNASNFAQPLVTANENLLIWAEAAYRTSDPGTALIKLNEERDLAGLPHIAAAGSALLKAILTEKYIANFQNIEAWNDYKRTCFPNFTPTVTGLIIPARLFYDLSERQTNTSIPSPTAQPSRNANDPANVTDDFGVACKGQTP